MSRPTYSFDVFDTCLCRLCGEPRNVFDVLSLKVQQAMGDDCNEHLRQLFVAARINAGGKDLHEIYTHVSEHYPLPCAIEQMVELELETEKEMLVPIVATRQLVNQLRKEGDILFISDMYLPSSFIQERLTEHGFFQEGDRLYVSDKLGAWKYDGSLFRLIHEREGIPYRHWHHYGDSRHSDYTVPRRLGIHAKHLSYGYLYYEEQWKNNLIVVGYHYPQILAGICRATRLMSPVPNAQSNFVTNISVPFMIAWVIYILNDAAKRGIRRLYFLARDVHSEYLIARKLGILFPEIESRYLFISSRALYNDNLSTEYLKQEGFTDGTTCALVDSCSSGHTTAEINKIIMSIGGISLHSYMIAKLHTKKSPCADTGDYILNDLYLQATAPKRISRISGMRIFFELLFSLNHHPTISGYEYHGTRLRPTFGKDENDEWFFDNMDVRTAKRNNDYLSDTMTRAFLSTRIDNFHSQILEFIAIPTLIDFVDCPRKEYMEYLHHFIWWGKAFVGHLIGKEKGVWSRGNRAYCIPRWLLKIYYSLLHNITIRRKLNHLISCLHL